MRPVLVDTMTTIFNIDDMNSVFLVKGVKNFYILEEGKLQNENLGSV